MSEEQQPLIVKSRQELNAELARLTADGWKVMQNFPPLFPNSADITKITSTLTLERNGEKQVIKIDNFGSKLANAGLQVQLFRNKLLLVLLLAAIIVLVLMHVFGSH
jgi:hypothetical protein